MYEFLLCQNTYEICIIISHLTSSHVISHQDILSSLPIILILYIILAKNHYFFKKLLKSNNSHHISPYPKTLNKNLKEQVSAVSIKYYRMFALSDNICTTQTLSPQARIFNKRAGSEQSLSCFSCFFLYLGTKYLLSNIRDFSLLLLFR